MKAIVSFGFTLLKGNRRQKEFSLVNLTFKFVWKIYIYISIQAQVMSDAFPRKEQNHHCEATMCKSFKSSLHDV